MWFYEHICFCFVFNIRFDIKKASFVYATKDLGGSQESVKRRRIVALVAVSTLWFTLLGSMS